MIGEERLVTNFHAITKYGFTLLRSRQEAEAWECRVAEIAPQSAADLARSEGPSLLERTASARTAAAKYLTWIGPTAPASDRLQKLEQLATSDQRALADKIAERHGGAIAARIAALALALFGAKTESGGAIPVDEDPPHRAELTWRMRIMIDAIAEDVSDSSEHSAE
jgi:hypothetical protein